MDTTESFIQKENAQVAVTVDPHTATAYHSYFYIQGISSELYEFIDKSIYGVCDAFIRVFWVNSEYAYPDVTNIKFARLLLESIYAITTICMAHATETECIGSSNLGGSKWRNQFSSCYLQTSNDTASVTTTSLPVPDHTSKLLVWPSVHPCAASISRPSLLPSSILTVAPSGFHPPIPRPI